MTYQPPLIGTKQLLNFTATSWPAIGGVLAGVAFALALAALFVSYRRVARLAPASLALAAACAAANPAIAFGADACVECRMVVSDRRFGAVAGDAAWQALPFDSIDCLLKYQARQKDPAPRAVWVVDGGGAGHADSRSQKPSWRRTPRCILRWGSWCPSEPPVRGRGIAILLAVAAPAAHAQRAIEVHPGRPPSIADAVRLARPGDRIVISRGRLPRADDRRRSAADDLRRARCGARRRGGDAHPAHRGGRRDRARPHPPQRGARATSRTAPPFGPARFAAVASRTIASRTRSSASTSPARPAVASRATSSRRAAAAKIGSGNGIHLWTARDIDVADNRVTGHRDGIYLEFVHDVRVAGNHSEAQSPLRPALHVLRRLPLRAQRVPRATRPASR